MSVDPDGADLPRPPREGLDGVEDVFVYEPGLPGSGPDYLTVSKDMLLDAAGRLVPIMAWNGSDWVRVSPDWRP